MKRIKLFLKAFIFISLFFTSSCSSQQPDLAVSGKSIERIQQIADSYGENLGFSGSILIAQGERILFNKSYGNADVEKGIVNTSTTKFRLASISKQLTAAALLVLEQKGKLSLDRPVIEYTSRLNPDLAKKITLHQILSHSSGLGRDIESLTEKNLGQSFISLDEVMALINRSELFFKPGTQWSYSNLGYAVAAAIIEDVTGLSFGKAMDELLFRPLKMLNTGHETSKRKTTHMAKGYVALPDEVINAGYEDKSYVIGAGSIYSTAEDLFLWARAVMDGDFFNKKNRERLLKRQAGRYSYGWFVATYVWPPVNKKTQATNIHHDGGSPGFSTKISILSKHDIVVIILSNRLPAHIGELTNKLTNIALGFDDEALARPDGTKEFFSVLLSQPADSVIALETKWKTEGKQLYIPNRQDIFLIGRGYIDSKNHENAIKVMDYLIEMYPKWDYPYLFKGFVMESTGQRSEAMELYQKVLEINPSQSNALGRLKLLEK